MAIPSQIDKIPLKAEINLSQNKLDVERPSKGGWLKDNGNLYGNVLSPVYVDENSSTGDFWDKNENPYTLTYNEQVGTINKGSAVAMTGFSKNGFVKSKMDLLNIDSLFYVNDTSYLYTQLTDSGVDIKYHGTAAADETRASFSGTVLATRCCDITTVILFYKNNNTYYARKYNVQDPNNVVYTDIECSFTNVKSPVINYHKYSDETAIVSIISDHGASVDAETANFTIVGNTFAACEFDFTGSVSYSNTLKANKFGINYLITHNEYSFSGEISDGNFKTPYASQFIGLVNPYYSATDTVQNSMKVYFQDCRVAADTSHPHGYVSKSEIFSAAIDTSRSYLLGDLNSDSSIKLGYYKDTSGTNVTTIGPSALKTLMETQVQSYMWEHNAGNARWTYNDLGFFYDDAHTYYAGFIWIDMGNIGYINPTQTMLDNASTNDYQIKFANALEARSVSTSFAAPSKWSGNWQYAKAYELQRLPLAMYANWQIDIDADGDWFYNTYEQVVVTSSDDKCDAILDNGKFIRVTPPSTTDSAGTYNDGKYCYSGTYLSYDSENAKIMYTPSSDEAILLNQNQSIQTPYYPVYYKASAISLGTNYYRNSLISTSVPVNDEAREIHTLFDSAYGFNLLNAGYNTSTNTSSKGSYGKCGNWRILYNNGYISGISYAENDNVIGTLLTDWNTIEKILFYDANSIFYLDNYGSLNKIGIATMDASSMNMIEDRFLVVNTTSYYNCYDTKTGQRLHWASDYNNRFFDGLKCGLLEYTVANTSKISPEPNATWISAAAQNPCYENGLSRIISSSIWNQEVTKNVYHYDTYSLVGCEGGNAPIDFFYAEDETVAVYDKSYRNGTYFYDSTYDALTYPIMDSMYYNPNLFSTFVKTYNISDMVISQGTAYPLEKYNGQQIMLYQLLNGLENMESVFVIQTLYYGIGNNKIWEIYYNGTSVESYQAIMDIEGMTYLGQLPTEALFWCPLDRTIYTFKGDAMLTPLWQCNDISEVTGTWYNPAAQELFISTDIGLLCVSNKCTYLLSEYTNVSHMYFYPTHFLFKSDYADGTSVSNDTEYRVAYDWSNVLSQSDNHYLKLKTKYLGLEENALIKANCLYIRFAKYKDSGSDTVVVKSTTITDIGTTTGEITKTITQADFDADTKSYYLRYQPQNQKCVGISFDIKTTMPIISMSLGYTTLNEAGQQTAPVANI